MNEKVIEAVLTCEEFFPSLLAGGAIRDFLNDNEDVISDYDIFLQTYKELKDTWINSSHPAIKKLKQDKLLLFAALGHTPSTTHPSSRSDYSSDIIESECKIDYKGYPLNLIFVTQPPKEYIQNIFDIGLCECWLDIKKERFDYTEAYLRDENDKTLTFNIKKAHTSNQIAGTIEKRFPKLLLKYPDHKVQIKHYLYP